MVVGAGVVADEGEVADTAAVQGGEQVFGDADDAEAADHDCRAVVNHGDGGVGVGDDLVHAANYSGVVRRRRARAAASKRALVALTVVEGAGGVGRGAGPSR